MNRIINGPWLLQREFNLRQGCNHCVTCLLAYGFIAPQLEESDKKGWVKLWASLFKIDNLNGKDKN